MDHYKLYVDKTNHEYLLLEIEEDYNQEVVNYLNGSGKKGHNHLGKLKAKERPQSV